MSYQSARNVEDRWSSTRICKRTFVVTLKSLLTPWRKLCAAMVTASELASAAASDADDATLCRWVQEGSAWAALVLAIRTRPLGLEELLTTVDATGGHRERTFDACADGYCVFDDARTRGQL